MEFSELKKRRLGSLAFAEYVTMQEAKETGIVPKEYRNSFKNLCGPLCGSEIIIKNTRTQYMCCNPRCPYKMADCLHYIFKSFSCANVGPETCKDVVFSTYGDMGRPSHLVALLTPEEKLPSTLKYGSMVSFLDGVDKIRNTRLTFAQAVSRVGVPGFGPDSVSTFRDLNNIQQFVETIQRHEKVDAFLASRNVHSLSKAFYLQEFLWDIGLAATQVFKEVTASGIIELPIVITGTLTLPTGKISRDDYIIKCNSDVTLDDGRKLFDIKSTKQRETTEFLVADVPSGYESYSVAERRERMENRKLIYSSVEFLDFLKGHVEAFKKWESDKEDSSDG